MTEILSENISESPDTTSPAEADAAERDLFESEPSGYVLPISDFERIVPEAQNSSRPIPPLVDVIEAIKQHRLVFLSGQSSDRRRLARHCAFEWAELAPSLKQLEKEVSAIEARPQVIDFALLEKEPSPSVFLFTNIDPAVFHRQRSILWQALDRHWVIIATDRSSEAWHIDEDLRPHWISLDSALYQPADLKRYLRERLNGVVAFSFPGEGLTEEMADEMVSRLKHPDAIDAFTRELSRVCAAGEAPQFDELIRKAQDNKQVVASWFQYELDPREKVAALSFALLHKLEEDIGFIAAEKLMERAWRKRDAALPFIDYGDLTNVRLYFSFDSQDSICCASDSVRSVLLATAWQTHRRQILAALPILVDMALSSPRGNDYPEFRFISRQQRQQFREVIGTTLGEICLLAANAVEPSLLMLMASGNAGAHGVVGRALRMVRREKGGDQVVSDFLARWQSDNALWDVLAELAGGGASDITPELVGAAIVTIMAELAMEDPVDAIIPSLQTKLVEYASAREGKVFRRYCDLTMPEVTRQHPIQMISLVGGILDRIGNGREVSNRFAKGFGLGLGQAINSGRRDVWERIEAWVESAYPHDRKGFDQNLVTRREQELSIALYALGEVRSGTGTDPQAAVRLINVVLREELHPAVRSAALFAIGRLMQNEYGEVSEGLRQTVQALAREERAEFIGSLVDLHCFQRGRQKGGDTRIFVKGRSRSYRCPIWYGQDPENTPVYDTLFAWSGDGNGTDLASFASDTAAEIRRVIERSEERTRTRMVEMREREKERQAALAQTAAPKLDRHEAQLSFLQRHLAVRLVTIGRADIRNQVIGLLHTILKLTEGEALELTARYRKEGEARPASDIEGQRLIGIASAAQSALWISRHLKVGAILFLGLFGLIAFLLRR